MSELINIATAIGYAYLIFAVIVAIIVFVITLRYFGKIRREMAEMEQRHKEMRERFEGKRSTKSSCDIIAKTNEGFAMKLEPKELRKFIADSEIEAMSKIELLSLTDTELVLMVDSVINQSVNALINTANALSGLFGNKNK